jgi:hypothetical protein
VFCYAIYITEKRKTTLLDKGDFDHTRTVFAMLLAERPDAQRQRYSIKNGQKVLSSFHAGNRRYSFRQFKKKRIVASALH